MQFSIQYLEQSRRMHEIPVIHQRDISLFEWKNKPLCFLNQLFEVMSTHKCCRKQLVQFNHSFKKYIIMKTLCVGNEGDQGIRKVSLEEKG